MSGDIRLSVIIPAFNEEENIERSIRSAKEANEVVVVDGGSLDDTLALAKTCGASTVESDKGRGRQLLAGVKASSGDVLLFLHADSWLGEFAVQQLREHAFERSGKALFGCFRQQIEDRRARFRIVEAGNSFRARRLSMPYGDQAIFVDRASYDAVGGLDDVPLMEDVMFSRKLRSVKRPELLPGPVHLSARRWHSRGVIGQTLLNWTIFTAFSLGVSPETLADWYG